MVARHHHRDLDALRLIRTYVRKWPGENSQKIHKKLLDFCVEIWYNIYVPKEDKKGEIKMAYGVAVTATVKYWCMLSDEDSEKVDELVRKSEEDPNSIFPYTLEEAVRALYNSGEISLYDNSVESDFDTQNIDSVSELS